MPKMIYIIILIICLVGGIRSEYNRDVVIQQILKTDTTSIGQKISYPQFQNCEVTIAKVIIPPGKSTGWHKHSFPVFAYILKGTLTVALTNGQILQFSENSSFAEVINTFHNGKNNGNEDVVLLAFYMGEKNKPLSIRQDTLLKNLK